VRQRREELDQGPGCVRYGGKTPENLPWQGDRAERAGTAGIGCAEERGRGPAPFGEGERLNLLFFWKLPIADRLDQQTGVVRDDSIHTPFRETAHASWSVDCPGKYLATGGMQFVDQLLCQQFLLHDDVFGWEF